ncbi:hypothetical protein CsSME_00015693 [Camellia sinensis var. sinensis]
MIEDSGAVNGVILADGTMVHSSVVLSNATPYKTFMELLPENVLPDDFICAIKHLDYSSIALPLLDFVGSTSSFGKEYHCGIVHSQGQPYDFPLGVFFSLDGFLVEFCRLEVFDGVEFDKWVDKAMAPPIESSLKLYEEVLKLGFKVFLLTGRSEQQSGVAVANLINSGFQDWDKLILRATKDHGKLATIYKSKKRNEMVEEGYWILGNSRDQWSDLLGSSVSIHSFKLPNPMYYIP